VRGHNLVAVETGAIYLRVRATRWTGSLDISDSRNFHISFGIHVSRSRECIFYDICCPRVRSACKTMTTEAWCRDFRRTPSPSPGRIFAAPITPVIIDSSPLSSVEQPPITLPLYSPFQFSPVPGKDSPDAGAVRDADSPENGRPPVLGRSRGRENLQFSGERSTTQEMKPTLAKYADVDFFDLSNPLQRRAHAKRPRTAGAKSRAQLPTKL
jgi:hypothetical protein